MSSFGRLLTYRHRIAAALCGDRHSLPMARGVSLAWQVQQGSRSGVGGT